MLDALDDRLELILCEACGRAVLTLVLDVGGCGGDRHEALLAWPPPYPGSASVPLALPRERQRRCLVQCGRDARAPREGAPRCASRPGFARRTWAPMPVIH